MQLFTVLSTILVLFHVISTVSAQSYDDSQSQQQQSTTLTRENVESLLLVLSDACRAELEAALSTQADITLACREEIQAALVNLNIPLGQQPPPEQQEQQQQEQQQQPRKSGKRRTSDSGEKANQSSGIPPIYYVLAFVIAFFASIVGLAIYMSSQRASIAVKKPKKISKKKVSLVHPFHAVLRS